MAATGAPRRTIGQLLKQGWTEIPEIIASTGLALVGIGLSVYVLKKYDQEGGDNKRFKSTYVIMRPDDPRAKNLRKD